MTHYKVIPLQIPFKKQTFVMCYLMSYDKVKTWVDYATHVSLMMHNSSLSLSLSHLENGWKRREKESQSN